MVQGYGLPTVPSLSKSSQQDNRRALHNAIYMLPDNSPTMILLMLTSSTLPRPALPHDEAFLTTDKFALITLDRAKCGLAYSRGTQSGGLLPTRPYQILICPGCLGVEIRSLIHSQLLLLHRFAVFARYQRGTSHLRRVIPRSRLAMGG